MADFGVFPDFFRAGRDEALLRESRLSLEAIERPGSDANILVATGAAMADNVAGDAARCYASQFIDSADDDSGELDFLLFDRYGLVRKQAAPSVLSVDFSTTVINPSAFSIPSGTTLQTADGLQFQTTTPVVFPAGTAGPVSVAAQSVLAGADQQIKSGQLTSIISQIIGSPADLVVTNPLASFGAANEEGAAAFRRRGKLFFTTARRGTLDSIEAAALDVPGVATATAFETLDRLGRPNHVVELIVTDEFTDALADLTEVVPSYETQNAAFSVTVFNGLSDARPAGTFVNVRVAQVILQSVTLSLSFRAGSDVDSGSAGARSAVVNYLNERPPGSAFIVQEVIAILETVPELIVTGGEVVSPSGDVIPTPLQALRTTFALVRTVANPSSPGQVV